MLEKKLEQLLIKDSENTINNCNAAEFDELSKLLLKKLNSPLFKNKNARIITNYFDKILPFIAINKIDINILLLYSNLLIEQPNFKKKFIDGLKNTQYAEGINEVFYNISLCLGAEKFNSFIDNNLLKIISTMNVSNNFYPIILDILDEEKQRAFLNMLVENNCDIPYSSIKYKGNNKQIIYDNLPLFIKNAQNLYTLMNFVKDNPSALSKVKEYIDNNEEKAINSIFCETDHLMKITDSTIKEIIKMMVIEVVKNENVKFSDITYNGGGFSRVLLIGDKVIKLGSRMTKSFPNNPYIISPLLRKEFKINNESCFVEITERVDKVTTISHEELYQLYKHLRELGLVWTDIKASNVGRLRKDNIIYWNGNLNPSDEVLGLQSKRGNTILKKGDLVILDADFIYDEHDPNINYSDKKSLINEFEQRYQKEKNQVINEGLNLNNYETEEIQDRRVRK